LVIDGSVQQQFTGFDQQKEVLIVFLKRDFNRFRLTESHKGFSHQKQLSPA